VPRQAHGCRLVESQKKTAVARQLTFGLAVFTSSKPHVLVLLQLGNESSNTANPSSNSARFEGGTLCLLREASK
jgi:hypothetical protein